VGVCPSCGHGYPVGARFCAECGAALAAAAPVAQAERKTVTVLFADLVGFTSRAEQLDPEDVRAVLSPFYARLRAELERFGGTVEKFIGDAVMALFGAPVTHEDDPERAVRAALAIRDWVRGQEGQLEVRLGVTTGEALISLRARPDYGEGMAAGDVVNTAARLQAAAPVNGILVGERTFRATRAAIEYRAVSPVAAKGKREPVPVWEAVAARARLGVDVAHQARAVLVGRDRELAVLRDTLARVRAERAPQLVTLVGVPGIGKSRLLFELRQLVEAEPELVAWRQGRCLPYGEGVSFWALAEIVKAQAGILESDTADQAEAKLAQMTAEVMGGAPEAEWVARHLGTLAGAGGSGGAGGDRSEAFAAWRQFLEALAEARPLVLVFEDLHWADEGLLDFVDYVADWAGPVPLLVLATARPELLARRAGWGGGKPNAVTLSLAPLSGEDTARLIGLLLGRAVFEAGQQAQLLAHAGGNPLYAEQYVAMLADQAAAGAELAVPESVQAIIGARLDLLAPPEKRVLHDAAVIGKVFWPGAVAALGGTGGRSGQLDGAGLEECLHGLERKQFLQRERASSVAGQAQYAFTHVLVRDVAYGQIPRAARAEKHAAAAGWIESLGRTGDHAEMIAHHYTSALDLARAAGQDTTDLAPRARAALQAAGDRALALKALAPAAGYYRAALALWPKAAYKQRAGLLRPLGTVLYEGGDLSGAEAVLAEGAEVAAAAGLPAVQARTQVLLAQIHSSQGLGVAETLAECEAATAILDREGDLEGLAEAWLLAGQLRSWRGESPAGQQAAERALAYARQSGNRWVQMRARGWLVEILVELPVPVDAAIARAEQLRQEASGDPWAEPSTVGPLSLLYAYAGRFAEARDAFARAWSTFAGFGAKLIWAGGACRGGEIELVAKDPVAAERYLREGYDACRAMGERGLLATIAGVLAEAVYLQGRLDEAQQLTEEAQALAAADDIDAQARWRATRAKLLARRGQFPAARRLAAEAVALAAPTSWAVLHAQALMAQAEVNRLAGARDQAEASLREALQIYEDRHAVPLAEQTRATLASLTDQPSTKPA
jgi:class 3 adenylate cyclase/tetratricopeptide (TPR) repeat protein